MNDGARNAAQTVGLVQQPTVMREKTFVHKAMAFYGGKGGGEMGAPVFRKDIGNAGAGVADFHESPERHTTYGATPIYGAPRVNMRRVGRQLWHPLLRFDQLPAQPA